MADIQAASPHYPLDGMVAGSALVQITPAGPASRLALRARPDAIAPLSKALAVKLPQKPKTSAQGTAAKTKSRRALWLGPDEWLVIDESGADLMAAQALIRRVPVGESVLTAILDMVRRGRPDESDVEDVTRHVAWGPGPRASQALMLGCRARALLEGRLSPSVDDVVALARPILQHRMALNFGARAEGVTIEQIIERLVEPLA